MITKVQFADKNIKVEVTVTDIVTHEGHVAESHSHSIESKFHIETAARLTAKDLAQRLQSDFNASLEKSDG